jgi:hypothetical protein
MRLGDVKAVMAAAGINPASARDRMHAIELLVAYFKPADDVEGGAESSTAPPADKVLREPPVVHALETSSI